MNRGKHVGVVLATSEVRGDDPIRMERTPEHNQQLAPIWTSSDKRL